MDARTAVGAWWQSLIVIPWHTICTSSLSASPARAERAERAKRAPTTARTRGAERGARVGVGQGRSVRRAAALYSGDAISRSLDLST